MISTVIIQVCNQRKQMASVCYHSFHRRQRLRSRWCWLLVPSGCWMWLGKEWKTTKTTALCTAKVTARAFRSRFGGIKTWALQNSTKWAGRGVHSKMGSSLFLFPLCISLTCIFSKDYRIISFFFPLFSIKQKVLGLYLAPCTFTSPRIWVSWLVPSSPLLLLIAGLMRSQIPLWGIIHQKVNSFWNVAVCVRVSRCVLREALNSSQSLEITLNESRAEKEAIAKTENSSPWWFLKGRRQMGERKRWLAELCLWFAQCGISLDCVTPLCPGYKGTAAPWHTSWDRLRPLCVCDVVCCAFLHIQVLGPSSVLWEWNP